MFLIGTKVLLCAILQLGAVRRCAYCADVRLNYFNNAWVTDLTPYETDVEKGLCGPLVVYSVDRP